MQNPTVGERVHYVLPEGRRNHGQHRAAVIVRVFEDLSDAAHGYLVNLHVHLDGSNDGTSNVPSIEWATSVKYADPPLAEGHCWHWPERED